MSPDVIAVQVLPEWRLALHYQNGEKRCFDMRPLLAMRPWCRIAEPALFQQARVEYGTVVWPGEIDVAPETLYDDSVVL